MPLIHVICLLFGLPLIVHAENSRAANWLPKQVPSSARLSIAQVERIILPDFTNQRLVAAAEDLQDVYSDRVGIRPEIVADGETSSKQSIHFQLSHQRDSSGSFTIQRKRTTLWVRAASEEGLVNAAYALCRDVLGARWFWPTDLGLEYFGRPPQKFAEGIWKEAPSFAQRTLRPVQTDYGRRNRLNRSFKFNHALADIFTPQLFETNREVFSVVKGRVREPKGNRARDPQPHLAHPKAIDIAAEAAIAHFSSNPAANSFSLSINDNVMFDESEQTQALVTPLKYFRTRPDYTDYVFGFMNAVAEKVFDEAGYWQTVDGEPRYLTALAYFWTEPSPSIELHSRVMPVLTSDRAQWHDSDYRAEDKALIARWADSGAERIATWDYYFGAPYPYPRQMSDWIDQSLKYLSNEGVDVFFSQLPSAWGLDGPKAWLASELLWNVNQDADALLDEYYTHFFGDAAEPMRAFYGMAESHRNQHEGRADWIKFYKDEAGIGLFPLELLAEMRGLLNQAKAAVEGDIRRAARVDIVSQAFAFTQAYAEFNQSRRSLVIETLAGSPSLDELLLNYEEKRAHYEIVSDQITAQPLHRQLNAFTRQLQSDPKPLTLVEMAKKGSLSPERDDFSLAAWLAEPARYRSTFQNIVLNHEEGYQLNFLGPELPRVTGWHFDFRAAQHLKITGVEADRGIHVSGADVFAIFRDEPVFPERIYLLDTKLAWRISPDNRTQIKLIWTDINGKRLRTDLPLQLPWGESDEVQHLVIPFKSPERAYDVRVHFITSRQYEGDYLELHSVDFGVLAPVLKHP